MKVIAAVFHLSLLALAVSTFQKGKPGDSCSQSRDCRRGLVCDWKVCKIKLGRVCTGYPHLCAGGLPCIGRDQVKKCFPYKGPGMECHKTEFMICNPDISCCEKHYCKLLEGASCTDYPLLCKDGFKCLGRRGHKKCAMKKPPGGECGNNRDCVRGAMCVQGICKLNRGSRCEKYPFDCKPRLICFGGRRKFCLRAVLPGRSCNKKGIPCITGSECVRRKCRIGEGYSCTRFMRFCKKGLICTGPPHDKLCKKPADAGDQCGGTGGGVCKGGLVCEQHICKIKKGFMCSKAPHLCEQGCDCEFKRGRERCVEIIGKGHPCSKKDVTTLCKKGTVCKKGVCTKHKRKW